MNMIALFSDYGYEGPYLGQVKMVLHNLAPQETVIDLMADAPRNNPKASAYLLASIIKYTPVNTIIFAVVDPGVGGDAHRPVALNVHERWFIGPDNGLFDIALRDNADGKGFILYENKRPVSKSFHGRDIYAPACAAIANGEVTPGESFEWKAKHEYPDDLCEIIYIDHFGNAMTGIRASTVSENRTILVDTISIKHAETFSAVQEGECFWYENSNGLVEVAANLDSAAEMLQLHIGKPVIVD